MYEFLSNEGWSQTVPLFKQYFTFLCYYKVVYRKEI